MDHQSLFCKINTVVQKFEKIEKEWNNKQEGPREITLSKKEKQGICIEA